MLDTRLFNSQTALADYRSDVWRIVESQEDAATLSLVDDLAEQDLLEQMLDSAKPKYRAGTEGMHYLLKTAFRYPPLKYGSRFGSRLMPSYFYASEAPDTALNECAYYRFLFLDDMHEPYAESIRSEFTLFKVLAASDACLDLTAKYFASAHQRLRSPTSYQYSQRVGQWAYDEGKAEIIRFEPARQQAELQSTLRKNVAVAKPHVIRSPRPKQQQRWLCLTKSDGLTGSVSFSSRDSEVNYVFRLRDFCDSKGRLLRVT